MALSPGEDGGEDESGEGAGEGAGGGGDGLDGGGGGGGLEGAVAPVAALDQRRLLLLARLRLVLARRVPAKGIIAVD